MAAWEREAERASLEGPTGPLRLYRMEEFDVFEFSLLVMTKIYIKYPQIPIKYPPSPEHQNFFACGSHHF